MLKSVLCLVACFCALAVSARNEQELITNLQSRLVVLPKDNGSLIRSFTHHSQSYIYDQALAIIAFAKNNNQKEARALLKGLETRQLADGSLYFSYYLDGKSPYPEEGDRRIAGAISWVALAAVHYQNKFHSKEFVEFNQRVLQYLETQLQTIDVNGTKTKALRFAPQDIGPTLFRENETAALEHNLDAYAAFIHFGKLNKTDRWSKETQEIKKFILALWDKTDLHFWSGADFTTGAINKSELYLDNQSWSVLALDKNILKELSPIEALSMNCDLFMANHEGIIGFFDTKPTRGRARYKFVWSEGTIGQVLAMKKMGQSSCGDVSPEQFLSSMRKMQNKDGGISYATATENKDFTSESSVAGTAWLYFAATDMNPFEIDTIN
jgi:hypothetical protein